MLSVLARLLKPLNMSVYMFIGTRSSAATVLTDMCCVSFKLDTHLLWLPGCFATKLLCFCIWTIYKLRILYFKSPHFLQIKWGLLNVHIKLSRCEVVYDVGIMIVCWGHFKTDRYTIRYHIFRYWKLHLQIVEMCKILYWPIHSSCFAPQLCIHL